MSRDFIGWEGQKGVLKMIVFVALIVLLGGVIWATNRQTERITVLTGTGLATVTISEPGDGYSVIIRVTGNELDPGPVFHFNDETIWLYFYGRTTVTVSWRQEIKETYRHGRQIKQIQLDPQIVAID